DPLNHTTTYGYDDRNRVNQVTYPDDDTNPNNNPTERYGYDLASNRVYVTTPMGNVTSTAYDALNRPTQVDEAANDLLVMRTATMVYDAAGNLLSQTTGQAADPIYQHAATTSYAYDGLGRRTRVIEAYGDSVLQRTTTTVYDAAGSVLSVTDARNVIASYGYDAPNRRAATVEALNDRTLRRTATAVYDRARNAARAVAA